MNDQKYGLKWLRNKNTILNNFSKRYILKKLYPLISCFLFTGLFFCTNSFAQEKNIVDLSGTWRFMIDSLNVGVKQKWFKERLKEHVQLPGSITTNGMGNEVDIKTLWTGDILDSSYYKKPQYAKYRQPGNIKVPFWLQPVKYYKGIAWYQKTVTVPKYFEGKNISVFLERPHWQTTVWLDDKNIGAANSLGTPHQFSVKGLKAGEHVLTIRIDNGINELNVGEDSHSISDNTQGNWNGIIGKIELIARPAAGIENIQIYPNIQKKQVRIKIKFQNFSHKSQKAELQVRSMSAHPLAEKLKLLTKKINIDNTGDSLELVYPMGENPRLWDEFNPDIYRLKVRLKTKFGIDEKSVDFGMREIAAKGTQLTINNKLVFLRGTLDCAAYPLTGYPPTDVDAWTKVLRKIKSYGLNHVRYHSWSPPEAAFIAADRLGVYLQVECSSWANGDARIGEGRVLDKWIFDESRRMVEAYGNHPSFVMMAYGNEPKGEGHIKYLTGFVNYWKAKDSRRLYTTGAGWPLVAESDYNNPPQPRIQRWGEGLKSIINAEAPKADYNWAKRSSKWKNPTISHEIGQWCVYPDFEEIKKYTGILKPKNLEIFEDRLKENRLQHLADSFLLASGKLQVLCYKADVEAALRTPKFGGFQLLGLSDFPGQGTALVGVLNVFWDDKGYVNSKDFRQFCSPTVPLALFPKFSFYNNESLNIPVEVAYYGIEPLENVMPSWNIKDENGKVVFSGKLLAKNMPLGHNISLGGIDQALSSITKEARLQLNIEVADGHNSWDFFVYPSVLPEFKNQVLTKRTLDKEALDILDKGGNVLLSFKKGDIKPAMGGDVKIGFSSIFWNTSYTGGQAPTTLGILCDPKHPALAAFPTQYHSNWQWWDAMMHSNAIRLDSLAKDLKPIVRVIDDWYTANDLGLIFECKVGKGKLLVSGIDLLGDTKARPEARQLLYSLKKYMNSADFNPQNELNVKKIISLGYNN